MLIDSDESGRWVLLRANGVVQLVDVWTRTATVVPGRGHGLSRGGGQLVYLRTDAGVTTAVVRELASGAENSFGTEAPLWAADFDPSGRFLYLRTFVATGPGPADDGVDEPAGSCVRHRGGSEAGRMGRSTTTIIMLDDSANPRYLLPPGSSLVRQSYGGWPLMEAHDPDRVQIWTPYGVQTLFEGASWIRPEDVRTGGIVFFAMVGDTMTLMRQVDRSTLAIAPSAADPLANDPAPDSPLRGGATGVAATRDGRWLHIESGRLITADPDVRHAYADATRMVLIGDAYTIVEVDSGTVLHRHDLPARPSLARGRWVALRGEAGTAVLDLQQPAWVGHAPGPAVALAESGHVLVAASIDDGESMGPFRWQLPMQSP